MIESLTRHPFIFGVVGNEERIPPLGDTISWRGAKIPQEELYIPAGTHFPALIGPYWLLIGQDTCAFHAPNVTCI